MRHSVKVLADWSNWAGLKDAQYISLGPAARFVEPVGRVLQDGSVVSCLPSQTL